MLNIQNSEYEIILKTWNLETKFFDSCSTGVIIFRDGTQHKVQ